MTTPTLNPSTLSALFLTEALGVLSGFVRRGIRRQGLRRGNDRAVGRDRLGRGDNRRSGYGRLRHPLRTSGGRRIPTTIAGQDVVGSLGVTNDQGVLLHPDVTPEEVLLIEEVLGVPPMVGTVAFGSPYVGAGSCASNNGVIAGTETTGPELNRMEDALGLI